MCRYDYKASSTTELSLKLEDVYRPSKWHASVSCVEWVVDMATRPRMEKAKIKFEYIYWRKGSRAYINVSFGLPGEGFRLWNPQEKVDFLHHIMMINYKEAKNNLRWNYVILKNDLNFTWNWDWTWSVFVKLQPSTVWDVLN